MPDTLDPVRSSPEIGTKPKCCSRTGYLVVIMLLLIAVAVLAVALWWTMARPETVEPVVVEEPEVEEVVLEEHQEAYVAENTSYSLIREDNQALQEQFTYLVKMTKQLYDDEATGCLDLSELTDETGLVGLEAVENENIQAELLKMLDDLTEVDLFTEQVLQADKVLVDDENSFLATICQAEDSDTVSIVLLEHWSRATVADWDAENNRLSYYTTVSGLMDAAYSFIPQAIDGKHLFQTGYGDAGHTWWSFYLLDPDSGYPDLIEKCSGSHAYDEEEQSFTEEYNLTCAREYMPAE